MTVRVTVCIPAYNAEPFVSETLRSILSQDVDGLEVIVSDNASTDRTIEIVEAIADARVRLLRQTENLGPIRNWNAVMGAAQGEFLKLVCADDVLYPGVLARQLTALEGAGDGAVMAASPRDVIDEHGRLLLRARGLSGLQGVVDSDTALRTVVRSGTNPFGEPLCVLLRRTAAERAGGFDGTRPYVIDLEFWCRVLAFGDVVAVPEPAGAFRVNLSSWSRELAFRQGSQVSSFLRDLRRGQPRSVSTADLAVGTTKAWALSAARIASYAVLARRQHL